MTRLVSIQFRTAGKLYDFDAGELELAKGDRVVVETERGFALGEVIIAAREVEGEPEGEALRKVLRLASCEDLNQGCCNASRETEALRFCRQRISERKMEMKLVRAEYLFDGSKIIFYFTADGRVDFRELVKDLAHHFHTRIEMRQIGVRDEAKLVGGLGVCGRELCCCTFLRDFHPVSVKMAKEQGLALNPTKISGQCGRLLCCLGYEYETYCDLKRGLPRVGRKVEISGMNAEVVGIDIFAGQARVRFENGEERRLSAEDLARGELPQDAQEPASSPTARPSRARRPREPQRTSPPPASAVPAREETPPPGNEDRPRRKRSRGKRQGKQSTQEGETLASGAASSTKRDAPPQRRDTSTAAPQPPAEKSEGDKARRLRRRQRRKKPSQDQ